MNDTPKSRYLIITMKQLAVAVSGGLGLDLPHEETGFSPDLGLMAQMSPDEARQLAATLIR